MERRQRRSFTDDYKRQAVDLVASSGRSIGSVAKELGLRDSVLRRWVELRGAARLEPTAAARRPTTQATLPSADHAAEIARLQRENERLRMERDILKKSRSRSLRADLPLAALRMAISAQRPGAGLIHHSDRGVQYASAEYRKLLQSAGFKASMSRKADCYDNAPMESFFHTLKTELVYHTHYPTRDDATRDIFAYIEGFYNQTRRHSAIGYISPVEMELKAA